MAKVEVREVCDLCHRELPVLGNRCRSDNTSVYRFKRTIWRFFSERLSWAKYRQEDVVICGDCWESIGEQVRRGEE